VKQIVQSPRSGKLELLEVPAPSPGPGQVLVRSVYSVVSPGTEKMAMDFARTSLLGKARQRPDLVKQVTRKLLQEGPVQTYRAVSSRLDAPQPLGYSLAGIVESAGEGVVGLVPGDRVACAGAGYANHAEWNVVPENLVARVPDGVALDQAAYATVGAIALQGVRLAQPTLGEIAAVIGLGLIGQLAVQLLRANGCRVLGLDTDPARVKQALDQGAEWAFTPGELPDAWKDEVTQGHGVDLALLAASTDSNAPIELAGELCRLKGRVSIVGAVSMDLDRRTFYGKEIEVQVSMSYGPGRYAWRYEEAGFDYPLPYVRWTENRNLQAFLGLVASGSVDPRQLETETVPFAQAERAYEELAAGDRRALSMVFRYEDGAEGAAAARTLELDSTRRPAREGELGVAFLGAGNYAKGMLLPALQRCQGVRHQAIVTATGASARRTAERFGFASCSTDPGGVLEDEAVDLVFITTRHDSHAALALRALRAGKAVWLEKPVGLTQEEVDEVVGVAAQSGGFLTVGYNRRFSQHTAAIQRAFAQRQGPISIHYSVVPGPPPSGTWHTDPAVGGGRVVGEVCHFVDLCTHLVGSSPNSVYATGPGRDPDRDDTVVALLGFPDGSAASIEYLARASSELPKERIEVSGDGISARCENFKNTTIYAGKGVKSVNQDKGQAAAVAQVVAALRQGEPSPIPLEQIAGVCRATFAILESLRTGAPVRIA